MVLVGWKCRKSWGLFAVWIVSSRRWDFNITSILQFFSLQLAAYRRTWFNFSNLIEMADVITNCPDDKCARPRTRMLNCNAIAMQLQSLGPKLAHGYSASKCSSWYLLMKRSQSYCQTVTWLYCETVSQSSRVTARHSRSYCPTHFWYVSYFTWLAVHWRTLRDFSS